MHLDSGDEIKRNSLISELPEVEFISNLISGIVQILFSLGKIDLKKTFQDVFSPWRLARGRVELF